MLGALLGGAIWLQTAGPISQPTTHGYPLMPTVPLKIGFYDMHGRPAADDPVLKQFGKMHLDYLIVHHVEAGSGVVAARLAGLDQVVVGGVEQPGTSEGDCIFSHHPLSHLEMLAADSSPPGGFVQMGRWAESQVSDRLICLAAVDLPPSSRAPKAMEGVQQKWEGLTNSPNPLPPIIVDLDDASQIQPDDLVQSGTGWFDASSVFWDRSAAPPPGHLLFSSGWSLTGGQVVAAIRTIRCIALAG